MALDLALKLLLDVLNSTYAFQWKYAAFWKTDNRRDTILTLEGLYIDNTSFVHPEEHIHQVFGDCESLRMPSEHRCLSTFPLERCISSMSCHWYSLGEEIIGKVAHTGEQRWVHAKDVNCRIQYKYSEEWQLQFAAGIKTILLVPVDLRGILQLGSFNMVFEDLMFVKQVKELFSGPDHALESCISARSMALSYDLFNALYQNNLGSTGNFNCSAVPSPSLRVINMHQSDFGFISDACTQNHNTHPITALNGEYRTTENMGFYPIEEFFEPSEHSDFFQHETGHFFLEGIDYHPNLGSNNNVAQKDKEELDVAVREQFKGLENINFLEDDFEETGYFSFGTTLCRKHEPSPESENSSFVVDFTLTSGSSKHMEDMKNEKALSSVEEICALLDSESSGIYPLNTVLNDREPLDSHIAEDRLIDHAAGNIDQLVPAARDKSDMCYYDERSEISGTHLSSENSIKSADKTPEHSTCVKSYETNANATKNRKRINRRDESSNPRPRDRQLIQERMKELREVIPNGSKCSIDALLEKAANHFLFLQSFADRAGKLKQCADAVKKLDEQSTRDHQINVGQTADRILSSYGKWPLIVEDLDVPGHMLIEVQCKEHGIFLEVARVIRGLRLTILKGVLEHRSNKLWAHFIVEVSRGFQRVHILLPLMQVLQKSGGAL